MRNARPPLIATWMLERFQPGRLDEAAVGDLFEEFQSGRSARWYWRQVLSAIAAGFREEVVCHRAVLFFALLWSAIAPAWIEVTAPGNFPQIADWIRHIDWPWSSVCTISLILGPRFAFIWAGILTYLFLASGWDTRTRLKEIQISLVRSLSVFAPFWIGACAMTLLLHESSLQLIHWQSFMPAVTALVARSPYFATILWALWVATPTKKGNGALVS